MPKSFLPLYLCVAFLLLLSLTKANAQNQPPVVYGYTTAYMRPENKLTIGDGYPAIIGGATGDNLSNYGDALTNGCQMGSHAYRSAVSTSTAPARAANEGTFQVTWHWVGPANYPVQADLTIYNHSEAVVSLSMGTSSGTNFSQASINGAASTSDTTDGHTASYTHGNPSMSPDKTEHITADGQVTCVYDTIHTVSSLGIPGFDTSCDAYIHWDYVMNP